APEPRAPAGAAVLPTEAGAPIKAPVSLNGVPLTLIVDTGADRTVLSPAAVARAGLDVTRTSEVGVIGLTGRVVAREVTVERLDVVGRPIGPLAVIVHELDVADADGLLGRDVLDHFTLTVEPGARRAVLTPR
ncbi:MAG: retropepsin-like aspartic protease, partial [Candidatus Rokuibacteriota bacterium]